MNEHGGFKTGDKVEVKFRGHSNWQGDFTIVWFNLMTTLVRDTKSGEDYYVSIFHVRHPHIKVGKHGT